MRRTWIIGGALVALLATTTVWRFATNGDNPAAQPPTTAATVSSEGSDGLSTRRSETVATTTTPKLVSPEQARSETGAVEAAIRFLELDEQLFPKATPEQARALSASITSNGARRRLGDRAEKHQREILAKGNLEGLVLRLAPISTRVRNHTTKSSTVDVFFLRLWSFPAKGALDDYATAQIDLVWENNEWRLADSSVIDGPYPVARFSSRPIIASTAKRFEDTLAGYDDSALIP
jgi:hypothetical protein